jgi:thiamine-phosphate pyrophosphorylase
VSAREETRSRVRGLYGIADAEAAGGDPVRLGHDLLAGGCRLVQLRCKGWSPDDTLRAARALVETCRQVDATLIVNDDPEIAVAADADGVHLGQDDVSTGSARAILGPDRILGRSTNDLEQLRIAAGEADYVAFGPVFDTPRATDKKTVQGLGQLGAARAVAAIPLVAIGGIDADKLPLVKACGADAWAVIGAIASMTDRIAATRQLR